MLRCGSASYHDARYSPAVQINPSLNPPSLRSLLCRAFPPSAFHRERTPPHSHSPQSLNSSVLLVWHCQIHDRVEIFRHSVRRGLQNNLNSYRLPGHYTTSPCRVSLVSVRNGAGLNRARQHFGIGSKSNAHTQLGTIDLDECIERLYRKELLAESVIEAICAKAKELLMKESNVVHIQAPVTVVGDIHGQFFDLLEIFRIGGFCPNTNYLFLG